MNHLLLTQTHITYPVQKNKCFLAILNVFRMTGIKTNVYMYLYMYRCVTVIVTSGIETIVL